MALYAYRAVDDEGRISSGSLDASNPIDLELRLRRLGLDLVTFESSDWHGIIFEGPPPPIEVPSPPTG